MGEIMGNYDVLHKEAEIVRRVYGETLYDSVYPRRGGLGDTVEIRWLPTDRGGDGTDGVPAKPDHQPPEDSDSEALETPIGV